MTDASPRLIPIITGPTAVGKTALTTRLARRLKAEIISADSRQLYRQLDIGTAKPAQAEMAGVRHHFIDELDLDEPFSAGMFAIQAEERIEQVFSRNHQPIISGGSTLYLQALIAGLADIPKVDPRIRTRLKERLQAEGSPALYEELVAVDPDFADTLDPSKSQRIIRGLEVYLGTGEPLSSHFSNNRDPRFKYSLFVLNRDRSRLYEDINQRVRDMVARGLVDEVRGIKESGYDDSCNAVHTIGYREVLSHLRSESTLEEMIMLIQRNTRRYAKRQLTWFRKYADAIWIDMDSNTIDSAIDRVVTTLDRSRFGLSEPSEFP